MLPSRAFPAPARRLAVGFGDLKDWSGWKFGQVVAAMGRDTPAAN
jgi:hypothetical protein